MVRAAALPPARRVGPAVILVLVAGYAVLWFAVRPGGQPTTSYVGQFFGAEAVLLLSIGLVLISTLPWVETWFDGIDRAAIWHRRVAISGVVLLIPHIVLAANPHKSSLGPPLAIIGAAGLVILAGWAILPRWRAMLPGALHGPVLAIRDAPGVRQLRRAVGGYERWRYAHRATGLFVAAGFAHGLLDGTPFAHAPFLRWTLVAIGGTGLAFYVYREVLARHFVPLLDYQVASVRHVGTGIAEVTLVPLGRPVAFAPGQFAMLFLEGKDGWHRHPFTITSSPRERALSFAIKALGDDTSQLREFVQPGMPAVIGGPFGRFNHEKGTSRQLWIAGGIGITPFLSWLRALDDHPLRGAVDFFYLSSSADIPYAEEIKALADGHDLMHVHFVDSSSEGHLSAELVITTTGVSPDTVSVFLCGPAGMVRSLQTGFRRAGVASRGIYREYFDLRLARPIPAPLAGNNRTGRSARMEVSAIHNMIKPGQWKIGLAGLRKGGMVWVPLIDRAAAGSPARSPVALEAWWHPACYVRRRGRRTIVARRGSGVRSALRGLLRGPDLDVVLAFIAFAAPLIDPLASHQVKELTPLDTGLALVTALPLVMRRRYPLGVLVTVVPLLLVCLAVFHPDHAAAAVVMLVVFTVGLNGHRARALVVGALMAPVVAAGVLITSTGGDVPLKTVAYVAVVLGALAAGDAVRTRQELVRVLAQEEERDLGQRPECHLLAVGQAPAPVPPHVLHQAIKVLLKLPAQPRLAHPGRPGHQHQPRHPPPGRGMKQLPDRPQLRVPADGRRLQPIHPLRPAHPGQYPERPPQMLRLGLALQRMLAGVGEPDRALRRPLRRPIAEHLPRLGRRLHPRCGVHRITGHHPLVGGPQGDRHLPGHHPRPRRQPRDLGARSGHVSRPRCASGRTKTDRSAHTHSSSFASH